MALHPASNLPPDASGMADDALLDIVQRQTARFFWEGAHPVSGLARDRQKTTADPNNDLAAIGGTGFGVMAIVIATERHWVEPDAALSRLHAMLDLLECTPRYRGMFAHFVNGRTGETVPFRYRDDGADIVETTLLFQGLICAREYFAGADEPRTRLRQRIDRLLAEADWAWFTRGGNHLYWHWSPKHGWAMGHPIGGWNECLLAFVLAAGSARHPVDPQVFHSGFAGSEGFRNGRDYHGIALPLGMNFGGPLFFAHYSFCGLDPRGLKDRHADYWQQNVRHTLINQRHCVLNPHGYAGYGADCWGLTSSHGPRRYGAHAPDHDLGVITPSAALSSFPYAPAEAMQALRGFLKRPRRRIWGRFGFVDAFSESRNWFARSYLAVNQGPIVAMIENYRTGLLWNLFMRAPEVRRGLMRLGFSTPHMPTEPPAKVTNHEAGATIKQEERHVHEHARLRA
ncbi:glucoamylase family protein [Manganibacter manganicus]|uniref:glucoamylase family protein n=1 Tax=Manganibacter manganicus TaxID=1873176 RepID=UPI001FD93D0A|nr:glucoamylase family protein [Pseudaminobacter manganicus]